VVGDKKKFISALVVPNPEEVKKLLGDEFERLSPNELARHPKLNKAIQEAVDAVNEKLARYEQIKRFAVLTNTFSLETGEITPTLKVRRKAVIDQYIRTIEGLYEEAGDNNPLK